MNKTDLIESLSHRGGMSKADAGRCVDALFDTPGGIIARALQRGEKVQITGFGTFEPRRRKARSGRNPRTGEPIRIAAGTTATFRAGKGLRDSL
ncbi:MAG: HU family DNA-binding protein [Gemmatimonadota bacterium]|nr:MAG: HU family DNA-binding protein [Gemmatimonadota bacterium]